MSLKETIVADMKAAMRGKEVVRLETIRLLRAAIQRREVDDRVELDDQGVVQIIQKMVKQNSDAAEQFSKGGREDLADKEKAGISILESYLPEQMPEDEVTALIEQVISESGAESMKDMGKVMGILKARTQGRADMGAASAKIKSLLS
jgi:hypothetical protein